MPDDDEIRLTVPPDPDLAAVVVAAVAAVARNAGIGEEGVASARAAAEEAFAEALGHTTGEVVTLTARGAKREYWFELHRAEWTYDAHARAGS